MAEGALCAVEWRGLSYTENGNGRLRPQLSPLQTQWAFYRAFEWRGGNVGSVNKAEILTFCGDLLFLCMHFIQAIKWNR